MAEPIPVLMYHSIAPEIRDWAYKYLSIHPDLLEDQIHTLSKSGYVPVSLSELHQYVSGHRRLPRKSIVLTFDDGYLDNWVFAFPILRKYGFRATIFVSTDFIDRRDITRPNLADVWDGRTQEADLEWRGFLGMNEIRRMQVSDLVEIQGHCKTHTWHFTSNRIVDFHYPGDPYPWLAWNARPDRKPLYLEEDQTEMVPLGSPVYEHREAVVARRYFPDPAVERALSDHVASNGGRAFFGSHGWRAELDGVAERAACKPLGGRLESEEERMTRLHEEIALSKVELETLLEKPVSFLCWPGGAHDAGAVRVAAEAGYIAWTLGSRDQRPIRNLPGEDPAWIRRTAVAPWWIFRGKPRSFVDGEFLKHIIEHYKRFPLSGTRLKWYKLRKLLRSTFR